MACLHMSTRRFEYYDPLGSPNPTCFKALGQFLQDKTKLHDMTTWAVHQPRDTPRQSNGYDCGVFSLAFAEYRSQDKALAYSQADMNRFRQYICLDIMDSTPRTTVTAEPRVRRTRVTPGSSNALRQSVSIDSADDSADDVATEPSRVMDVTTQHVCAAPLKKRRLRRAVLSTDDEDDVEHNLDQVSASCLFACVYYIQSLLTYPGSTEERTGGYWR
jgi:hypothetical protein